MLWAVTSRTDKPDAAAASTAGLQAPPSGNVAPPTRKGGKTGGQKTVEPVKTTEETDPDEGDTALPDEDEVTPDPEETEETNKYKATQVCGDGYEELDAQALKSPAGVVKGRIFFLYRDSDGSNCVVTLRTTGLAKKGAASSFLEVQGQERKTDAGNFQYYAGPVKATAPDTCVKWGGSVGELTFESDFEHCG